MPYKLKRLLKSCLFNIGGGGGRVVQWVKGLAVQVCGAEF